jgi:hypothetical protein
MKLKSEINVHVIPLPDHKVQQWKRTLAGLLSAVMEQQHEENIEESKDKEINNAEIEIT